MDSQPFLFLVFFTLSTLLDLTTSSSSSSIVFTTLGRSRYSFDIFTAPTAPLSTAPNPVELQLTDGFSVNYNGFFPSDPPSSLLFVSERNGSSNIYLSPLSTPPSTRRSTLQLPLRPLLNSPPPLSMKDRPSLVGDHLVYVSTHVPSPFQRQSWAAVYSTHLPSATTTRLTPPGIADFSPAVSPSGNWTAVASYGASGWSGEVEDLKTGVYVFRTKDGSKRTKLVEHGGWPAWADDTTLYFHRESEDGWWSVYRVRIGIDGGGTISVASLDRITEPGFHAFTPAAGPAASGVIAVATRRADSQFRHIELVRIANGSNEYVEVTKPISPYAHHFNPFLSPDSQNVGYHRCRGGRNGSPPLRLENIVSPSPDEFSLLRIDGSFPSFSHDGERIAYVGLPGLYVVNSDGSGEPREVFPGNAFATAWDWKRRGVIYTSYGPDFAAESSRVDIISIALSEDENSEPLIKKLTLGGENNAFPSPSPDGKWVVFRSGRSGHKNLYIVDAVEGESGGIYRLTEGPWSDTMCSWSPDGEWIAFASDRDDPGAGTFAIYMVHPNGTGLRKVVHSGDGGRANHPWFSPDSKSLVFTTDYAAVSAEPISNPHHYQPYGEIFTVKIDGSDIQRLTHNSFEDGTPTWTPLFLKQADVPESLQSSDLCSFEDCHWLNIEAQLDSGLPRTGC